MVLNTTADLVAGLKRAGLKLTPQRLAIAECLAGDGTHPTAQELHQRLTERFPSMSMATVYNTLSALTRTAGCRELDLGGATRFDPNVTPHDHAVCERCGAIRDVELSPGYDATAGEQCPLPGFRVERIERVYRGLCAQCAKAA
jgi:Fur family peroxide stress response transcriptional regulator